MTIEIPFEIDDFAWFIHPRLFIAFHSQIKKIKIDIDGTERKIKYNMTVRPVFEGDEREVYVWSVFKTKDDLLKSL